MMSIPYEIKQGYIGYFSIFGKDVPDKDAQYLRIVQERNVPEADWPRLAVVSYGARIGLLNLTRMLLPRA